MRRLRRLEESNLVSRRIGSGTFVAYRERPDHAHVAETTSPLELIEVRFALEPHIVRLAVTNANGRDVERLRDALGEVVSAGMSPEDFSRADENFHLVLADCSRNPVMQWLYRHINDVRGHAQWSARKDTILTPERIREYNAEHQAVFSRGTHPQRGRGCQRDDPTSRKSARALDRTSRTEQLNRSNG